MGSRRLPLHATAQCATRSTLLCTAGRSRCCGSVLTSRKLQKDRWRPETRKILFRGLNTSAGKREKHGIATDGAPSCCWDELASAGNRADHRPTRSTTCAVPEPRRVTVLTVGISRSRAAGFQVRGPAGFGSDDGLQGTGSGPVLHQTSVKICSHASDTLSAVHDHAWYTN